MNRKYVSFSSKSSVCEETPSSSIPFFFKFVMVHVVNLPPWRVLPSFFQAIRRDGQDGGREELDHFIRCPVFTLASFSRLLVKTAHGVLRLWQPLSNQIILSDQTFSFYLFNQDLITKKGRNRGSTNKPADPLTKRTVDRTVTYSDPGLLCAMVITAWVVLSNI
jgi:hypothetical protein